jgi:hypothetical protein
LADRHSPSDHLVDLAVRRIALVAIHRIRITLDANGKNAEKRKRQTRLWERSDRVFTVASLALILFLATAGFSAWITDNPGPAAQGARQATVR